MMMNCAVIHYHEIALKGKNRPFFVSRLVENIRAATGDIPGLEVNKLWGRLLLTTREDEDRWPLMEERLKDVFGIANFSPAVRIGLDLETIKKLVGEEVVKHEFDSFRVSARRAYKAYPLTSQQINAQVGEHLVNLTGKRVDLTRPELNVHIELMHDEAFFYMRKIKGAGGLPVGVGGTVTALLSGGIDSPVAAFRMMRRGCRVVFVHFHSFPHLNKKSMEKAQDLAQHLTRRQNRSLLYMVPFGDIQKEVVVNAPPPLRVVIYRRLMLRIAEALARRNGAGALVTGESLGQVASQTLENISVIEKAVEMSVLRPLIGMDKDEISRQAMEIGTYETSIIPDQDCCQLFIPRNPATRSNLKEVLAAEEPLDVPRLVEQGVSGAEEREYSFP